MKSTAWKYRIGVDLFSFIPISAALLVFGGVSIWLYISDNGAMIFTFFLTAVVLMIGIYNLYSLLFVKILIGEDGFYHRNGPSDGKYYKYSDITEAWQSEGRSANGAVTHCLNYKTADGRTVKFVFAPFQSEGIEYLLMHINGEDHAE